MANPLTPEQISQILEEFFKVVGTRHYIGARYVPIFGRKGEESIEWDNSAPYEPLTIVLYQGNSYTSRQYVPVGVEITNQEFWALTGNYNAQIEQYRRDVQAFDARISANPTAMMAGNYNSIWIYFNVVLSYKNTDEVFKNMGFTGDTSIIAYIRLLDSNVYYKKLTDTKSFEVPTNIMLQLVNPGSCIIDLYVTNSGKVYHTQNIITDLAKTAYIIMNKYSVSANIGEQRYDSYHKASAYPVNDTPEIVKSIPEYTERKTAYLIAPNLFVDTTVTDGVKGYTRIDKTQLKEGGY